MKRLVFTFGTLYEDAIIEALLGTIPQNFYAKLTGYSLYKGNFSQVPPKVKDFFDTTGVDQNSFSYLFIKEDPHHNFVLDGRAYFIDLEQELILDHWELYPDWNRKMVVTITAEDGTTHEAFVYTQDIEGERLEEFKRVVNNPEKVLTRAKAARKRAVDKFPEAFKKKE